MKERKKSRECLCVCVCVLRILMNGLNAIGFLAMKSSVKRKTQAQHSGLLFVEKVDGTPQQIETIPSRRASTNFLTEGNETSELIGVLEGRWKGAGSNGPWGGALVNTCTRTLKNKRDSSSCNNINPHLRIGPGLDVCFTTEKKEDDNSTRELMAREREREKERERKRKRYKKRIFLFMRNLESLLGIFLLLFLLLLLPCQLNCFSLKWKKEKQMEQISMATFRPRTTLTGS